MMITAGRFVFFEIRSYPSEGFSNRPNPSSKILTSGDGAISLPDIMIYGVSLWSQPVGRQACLIQLIA